MRRLIINADDLGINSQRSHGIFMCHEDGVVTNSTILANFSSSDQAAKHAREKGLPSGLHLNLTEGSPLSKKSDIETLLTPDGYFKDRHSLRRQLREGEIEAVHIERELRAQFEWMLDSYGQPTHVDSHHHIHIHSTISKLLVPLLDRYGISYIRVPSEPISPFGFEIDETHKQKVESISAQAEEAKKLFAAHQVRSTDHFRGLTLVGHASQRNLRHILSRLPEGVTELMVHPGSPNPSGDPFSANPQRQTEMQMLLNPDTKAELKERKIELCSYGDLY